MTSRGGVLVCTTAGGISGQCLQSEFDRWGLPARWIATRCATRVCTTLLDRRGGTTTELVENAGPIDAHELAAFEQAFAEEAAAAQLVVLTGSLPPGAPATLFRDLLSTASAPALVDAQGPALLAALQARPLLVKPNREELARTLNRDLSADAELFAAMRELNAGGAAWVLVTQGAGPVWVSGQNELLRFDPAAVQVVNPIGSGDCLAAGVAHALARGESLPQAVSLGIAAAAENARHLLPARLDRARVLEEAARVRMTRMA